MPDADRAPLDGINVLVVEDDEDARYLLSVLLRHAGASVVVADSAQAALDALAGPPRVDVLVSDISMPAHDGFWLIRELRSRDRFRHIPAIAVTAMIYATDRRMILAAGYQAHVPKPVDFDALVATIRQVVADAPERADC